LSWAGLPNLHRWSWRWRWCSPRGAGGGRGLRRELLLGRPARAKAQRRRPRRRRCPARSGWPPRESCPVPAWAVRARAGSRGRRGSGGAGTPRLLAARGFLSREPGLLLRGPSAPSRRGRRWNERRWAGAVSSSPAFRPLQAGQERLVGPALLRGRISGSGSLSAEQLGRQHRAQAARRGPPPGGPSLLRHGGWELARR